MRTTFFSTTCLTLFITLATVSAHGATVVVRHDMISGRVVNSSTNTGIAGLRVQLDAPKTMHAPVRITITASDGAFQFPGLMVGRYLLTMYQGTKLVFRREIDTRKETEFTLPLRPVRQ